MHASDGAPAAKRCNTSVVMSALSLRCRVLRRTQRWWSHPDRSAWMVIGVGHEQVTHIDHITANCLTRTQMKALHVESATSPSLRSPLGPLECNGCRQQAVDPRPAQDVGGSHLICGASLQRPTTASPIPHTPRPPRAPNSHFCLQTQTERTGKFFNPRRQYRSATYAHQTSRAPHAASIDNPNAPIKKPGVSRAFSRICVKRSDYSATSSATTGRSTSSTYAIGALSPARKPAFRMRR